MARNFNVSIFIRSILLDFSSIFVSSIVTNNLKQSHIMEFSLKNCTAMSVEQIRYRISSRRYPTLFRVKVGSRYMILLGLINIPKGKAFILARTYFLGDRTAEKLFKYALDTEFPCIFDCIKPIDSL